MSQDAPHHRPLKHGRPTAYLVESIPQGLEDLRGTPDVRYTEDVLVELTQAATQSIDLTAMYWALLPDPTSADESGFTEDQLDEMGATTGRALFAALHDAAARGVNIRILEAPGFAKNADGTAATQESETLRAAFPKIVQIHQIEMKDWYGGAGIMHQKIWIFDEQDIYIGSANMDWKSIMQVKEMGIVVEQSSDVATDLRLYFENWWKFSAAKPSSVEVFDADAGIDRRVPPWSSLVSKPDRKRSPLRADTTPFNWENPLALDLNGETGSLFMSGSPDEVRGNNRTVDAEALVNTIDDARRSVCVSVMDFAPVGLYGRDDPGGPIGDQGEIPNDTPVWWPQLFSPLLAAALTRKVRVRLLVSKWAHTSEFVEPFLQALQQAADAGRASQYMSAGQLEVKLFEIPGWNDTSGHYRKLPGHTRVNHTKYIVTDRRINVGTSNMTWDYFSSTAGASFNANHAELVSNLQSVFDRDWASSYAYRLV